jgi:SNF2 family DNA or RNA helicase
VTAGANAIHVRLVGDEVHVSGPGLHSRRLRLYFATALGAALSEDGVWICSAHGAPVEDLLVGIVRRLEQQGLLVVPEGLPADRALENDFERGRSFVRARASAETLLELGVSGSDDVEVRVPEEAAVLATLRELGWNENDRPLMPHQRDGLMHALTAVNAANFSVPGAGKTATALSVAASHLATGTIDVVLVVGPLSCFRPWESEAALALPGVLAPVRLGGMTRDDRAERLRAARAGDLFLMSYQTAAGDQNELDRLCRRRRVMLIVDESHRVKRFRSGYWSDALIAIARRARIRLILSGTPMPQGPNDLWSQFTILWPGEELVGSRTVYGARASRSFPLVRRDLAPFMTRTGKADLGLRPRLDVPPHRVELAPLQREIYDLIADRLSAAIPPGSDRQQQLDALRRGQHIRLLQAASNPDLLNQEDGFFQLPPMDDPGADLFERLHEYRERELPAKFTFALDFLQTMKDQNAKCVVWTSFVRNISQLGALIEERVGGPLYRIHGSVPSADSAEPGDELDDTRERRIAEFLAADGFAVLLANPAACAESISLHSHCHTALYIDRTYDCARWLQSIDRIHRLGLPADVTVEIHVIETVIDGADTIDGLVDSSLQRKTVRMQQLLEGAELQTQHLALQDTLEAAQGDVTDLRDVLEYLIGQTP